MKLCFWFIHYWTKWGDITKDTFHHASSVGSISQVDDVPVEKQERNCSECNIKQIRYFHPLDTSS